MADWRASPLGNRWFVGEYVDLLAWRSTCRPGEDPSGYPSNRDGGDEIAGAWAEGLHGLLLTLAGDLDGGIRVQEAVVDFLDRVPDCQGATGVRGNLARCYVRRGAVQEAQEVIAAALVCIGQHKVRGVACT